MKNVLILGAKGMLGCQLQKLLPGAVAWDREDVDVTDSAALESRMAGLDARPSAVINCVAFNDVDGAEQKQEAAFALNAEVPAQLARLTRALGIPLVHYSTNYVFDGVKGEYLESDAPSPLSVYGASKRRGEELVAENGGDFYILRTAVIFGPKGTSDVSKRSFVELMLDLSARTASLKAVEDEVNSVTYAPDLALATQRILEQAPASGIYHVSNSGSASWYGFAREIFRIAGRDVELTPVPSSHFPRPARRPGRAVLLNTKLPPVRPWTEALREFLAAQPVA